MHTLLKFLQNVAFIESAPPEFEYTQGFGAILGLKTLKLDNLSGITEEH